jgi:hypothetical protein
MTRSGMSTKITGTEMSSDVTPHTATAWPVPGAHGPSPVRWLLAARSRDQIQAMQLGAALAIELEITLSDDLES